MLIILPDLGVGDAEKPLHKPILVHCFTDYGNTEISILLGFIHGWPILVAHLL